MKQSGREKDYYLDLIRRAERLRVEASAGGKFDDQKYSQALELLRPAIQAISSENIPDDDSLIAAGAHLFLLASAIQQSRALHTISEFREKQLALEKAKQWLEQAEPLVRVLDEHRYYWAIDETPWIWKTEWLRGMARVYQHWPSRTEEEKRANQAKAVDNYQQALTTAQQVSENKDVDGQVRASALMAVGTVRVELALVQEARGQIDSNSLREELAKAFTEVNVAWNQGYENLDRFIATSSRIVRRLREMSDNQSQSLLKQITQTVIPVLESRKDDPVVQKWLQKAKEVLSNQENSLS